MLSRTRISGKMDTGRLGQAVARPGIDPRTWVSLAVALDESKVDPAYGVFVNVQLMPTGEKYTAIVASDYVGQGFGLYAPIHINDDLIVVIPSGDPRLGVTVVKRLWSAADTPPTEAGAQPTEVMLVIEPDKSLRLKVTGGGLLHLDAPHVKIGDATANDALVTMLDGSKSVTIAEALQALYTNLKNIFDAHVHPTGVGPSGPTATPAPPWDAAIVSTKIKIPNG